MTQQKKKHSFRNSFTLKIVIGIMVITLLGILYNQFVKSKETITAEQIEEEKREAATLDTLDIVGDYLWRNKQIPVVEKIEEKKKTEEPYVKNKKVESIKNTEEIDMPDLHIPSTPPPPSENNTQTSATTEVTE